MNDYLFLAVQLIKVAALFLASWALIYAFMLITP